MLSILALLLSATPTPPAPAAAPSAFALLDSPYRHVRTTDRYLQDLLRIGFRRSPTFASLLAQLNDTDVIVYLEPVQALPAPISGQLQLLAQDHSQRYLRIQVLAGLGRTELIALMGHELRHALEVAQAPGVRDERALVRLYECIGQRFSKGHQYDTDAAQNAGRAVRKELVA